MKKDYIPIKGLVKKQEYAMMLKCCNLMKIRLEVFVSSLLKLGLEKFVQDYNLEKYENQRKD